MLTFTDRVIVNISSDTFLDGPCSVSVRINSSSNNISKLKSFYGKRVFNFEIKDNSYADTKLLQLLEGSRVRIHVSDNNISAIARNINTFRKICPIFVLEPDKDLLKKINFLTALNFPIHINTHLPVKSKKTLIKALDFYLHNPLLQVPVEPFHTLLQTENSGKGFNLWNTEMENIKTNFYVNKNKKVTLSSRWDNKGLYYGTLKNSWEEIISSELFNNLLSFKQTLFQKQSPCVFCTHFKLCGGYLRAIDADRPCDDWKTVFETISRTAQEAKKLLRVCNKMQVRNEVERKGYGQGHRSKKPAGIL